MAYKISFPHANCLWPELENPPKDNKGGTDGLNIPLKTVHFVNQRLELDLVENSL
jgi:hypothetical protein